jgi:hypothetical protein
MDAIPTIRFICLVFFAVRIYSYPYPVSRLFATLFFLFQLEGIEININILRRAPSRRVTALARARKFRRFLATCTATCPRSPSGTAFYPLYVPYYNSFIMQLYTIGCALRDGPILLPCLPHYDLHCSSSQ